MTETDHTPDPESAPESRAPAGEIAPREAPKAAPVVAGVALLVALGAGVASAWLWLSPPQQPVDDRIEAARIQALDERIGALEGQIEGLPERLGDQQQSVDRVSVQFDDLSGRLQELSSDQARIDRRLDELETSLGQAVERLQQAGGEQRADERELARRVALVETAALLRLGQARAELAGDWQSARAAYRRAADRLESIDDPRLNRARSLVTRESSALESMDSPDWIELAGELAVLAAESRDWPETGSHRSELQAPIEQESGDGWWASLRASMGRLVRVERLDESALSADQVDAVKEQLRMRLVAAELAATSGNEAALAYHASKALERIEGVFDSGHQGVSRARARLSELAALEPVAGPDLGAALAEVNRLLDNP